MSAASQKSGRDPACALGSIFFGRLFFLVRFLLAMQKKMNEDTDEPA
jgi:hypothetical protein